MKEAYGGAFARSVSARGGADWIDVSPRHRCPVCGSDSWCQVSRDGSAVLCKRVASERERVNRNRVTFYVHRPDGGPRTPRRELHPAPPPTVERAPADVLHRAHSIILAQLSLYANDRAGLLSRGLDARAIAANAYRSARSARPAQVARAVVADLGEDLARRVPGIVWRHRSGEDPSRGWWHWRAADGVLIPVRDLEGRVVALKVRRREVAEGGNRYVYVSSAARREQVGPFVDLAGPSAACAVHVPAAARAMRETSRRLVITEGELKSDISTALLGEPVVSIPGVGAWAAGVDLAEAWGAPVVAVALDMDARCNRYVARALDCVVSELRRAGLEARVWTWPPKFKGLDDYLARDLARSTDNRTETA